MYLIILFICMEQSLIIIHSNIQPTTRHTGNVKNLEFFENMCSISFRYQSAVDIFFLSLRE